MMKALVLEKVRELRLRDIQIDEPLGANDVRIAIDTVGVCGSDVHYYQHGSIGPFIVKEPMVLGHEAAGKVMEVGAAVKNLKKGDRVCMEPGIPDAGSKASRLGIYNLDPAVRFWATPPIHGCLRPTVVHPAAYTFKLPDNVTMGEGAMVEPLAVGMHAATKAKIKPGDVALVIGAGPIGMVTALSALAGGCAEVFIADVQEAKLALAKNYPGVRPVHLLSQNLGEIIKERTEGWGVDIVFEASGNAKAVSGVFEHLCPGGVVVFIGMPGGPVPLDIVAAQVKEARMETVFRYAHVYPKAIGLMGSGKINLKPLITDVYSFADSVKAFEYADKPKAETLKIQIKLEGAEK
jgi:D-xylulose reductase